MVLRQNIVKQRAVGLIIRNNDQDREVHILADHLDLIVRPKNTRNTGDTVGQVKLETCLQKTTARDESGGG